MPPLGLQGVEEVGGWWGVCLGMWCGAQGRAAMGLGSRSRSGVASAHPRDAGEGQSKAVWGISSSLGA